MKSRKEFWEALRQLALTRAARVALEALKKDDR